MMWIVSADFNMFDVFLEILVCNLTLNKYERYKKVFRGALKLQRPLFLQSMFVADCVALQMLRFCENPSISRYLRAKCCRPHGAHGAVWASNRAGGEPNGTERSIPRRTRPMLPVGWGSQCAVARIGPTLPMSAADKNATRRWLPKTICLANNIYWWNVRSRRISQRQ